MRGAAFSFGLRFVLQSITRGWSVICKSGPILILIAVIAFGLKGYALGGTRAEISRKGFESVKVSIDRNTESIVEVFLKPK